MNYYPALIFWMLIVWSVTAKPSTLLVLSLASIPFAGLALIPPEIVGMSILPQSVFAAILVLKVIAPQLLPLSPKLLNALRLRNLGFLALFLLVGLVATVIMPRLFAEEIIVVPMRENSTTGLLAVTMQNFTQSGYVSLSVMTVFAVTLMAYERSFARTLLVGVLAGGLVSIVTGLIDLAAAAAGMENLLEPFRTADYAFLTSDQVAGVKRVVGFTSEASAYGPICVDFAVATALLRNLYAEGPQRILATAVAIGLVAMGVLSTSSTAFLGLALCGIIYTANWARRAVFSSELGQRGLIAELLVGLGLLAALVFILIARADLFDPLVNIIQEVIFKKPLTSSYYQRSEWSRVAWETVGSTWGLGVGFGSTRASSWFAAIASSAGLIGATCLAIFLIQTFARRPSSPSAISDELLAGLKLSLLPALAMVGASASGPDFGLWMAVALGAIAGIVESYPQMVSSVSSSRFGTRSAARVESLNGNAPSASLPYWRQRTGAVASKRSP